MMALLLLIPLALAVISLIRFEWVWARTGSVLAFVGMSSVVYRLAHAELPRILTVGDWPHFAGITWMCDELSLVFISGALCAYLPTAWILARSKGKSAYTLFHFLLAACIGVFLTADLFNLFVMFEVMLLSSYALFFDVRELRQAKLFIWMNVLGSALFLWAIAFLYRCVHAVNMVDVSLRLPQLPTQEQIIIYGLFATVFLIKAGAFPVHIWMAKSYPALSNALLAFLAAILSKVGIYCLLRFHLLVAPELGAHFQTLYAALGVLTLILGLMGAFAKEDLKEALLYFSLSHMGIYLIALSLPYSDALSGLLIFFLQDVFATVGLFFACEQLERGGPRKLLLAFFLLFGLSYSAFPPTAAFWGEWLILNASIGSAPIFLFLSLSAFVSLVLTFRILVRFIPSPAVPPQKVKSFSSELTFAALGLVFISLVLIKTPNPFSEIVSQLSDPNRIVQMTIDASQRPLVKGVPAP